MIRILKVSVVIALAAVLVVGMTICAGCGTNDISNGNPNGNQPNGDVANGDTPNGNEPNGNEPNGDVPNGIAQPDLTSGFGIIIECEDTAINIDIGDSLPDFTFQDATGQTFSLSDFKGKAVMLNFWRISCHWCSVEMPYIQQVYDQWPDEDVVILTINIADSAEEVAEFLQEHELSLPVLLDTEAELATKYLVNAYPLSFFIDKGGAFQGVWPGALSSAEQLESILEQLSAL